MKFAVKTRKGYVTLTLARRGGFEVTSYIGNAYQCSKEQAEIIAARVRRHAPGHEPKVVEV